MLFNRRLRVRIRGRIRVSVWSVICCYAHVFVPLQVVIVTLPRAKRGKPLAWDVTVSDMYTGCMRTPVSAAEP